jgi:hypothetical protein
MGKKAVSFDCLLPSAFSADFGTVLAAFVVGFATATVFVWL